MRLLKADEIEVRVCAISKDGLILLMYKDARADQNMLDEEYGQLGWQRTHQVINNRLYCTVSVWDDYKKQWVHKQDVGTEGSFEKEKGAASDSFKRACFLWGIGRELYTAPNIFVPADKCNIILDAGKFNCKDRFCVKEIKYKNAKISHLVIYNKTKDIVAFDLKEEKK